MRVCVVLSGSIRLHPKSLSVLRNWWGDHSVDTYIHTWKGVSEIHKEHWHLPDAEEPTDDLIASYHAKSVDIEDWETRKKFLREEADRLQSATLRPIYNINLMAMYYSMSRAYALAHPHLLDYDVVVRMRFDNAVHDSIFENRFKDGWVIPAECDFSGINDRFGWLWVDRAAPNRTRKWASAYLNLYRSLPYLLKSGCEYCPEKLLLASLNAVNATVTRVPFRYSILGFS